MDGSASPKILVPLRILGTFVWIAFLVLVLVAVPVSMAYWATALLSCLIFYLVYRPSLLDACVALAAAAGFAAFWMGAMIHRVEMPDMGVILALLGLGGWCVVGIRLIWMQDPADRGDLFSKVVIPSAVLLILLFASNNLVNYMGLLQMRTYDVYAYAFDGSLGFQPSFVLGGWMNHYAWFGRPILVMYLCILLPITFAFAVDTKKGLNRPFFMLELFFLASFLGYLFYNLFPAAGPAYVFRTFPVPPLNHIQTAHLRLNTILLDPRVMRNALPSLHMTWVLLIWWNMKKLTRIGYWLAFAYVLFTVCGTLGTGEHYAIDLVVAFPFALMIQGLAERAVPFRSAIRSGAVFGGLAAVFGWVFLLRFEAHLFWISPAVPWTLIAITVVVSLVTLFRLLAVAEVANANAAPVPKLEPIAEPQLT